MRLSKRAILNDRNSLKIIQEEIVKERIYLIRSKKVMLDSDLAVLYGIQTFRFNEAVKRNRKRFPDDFMFQLTESEKREVIANCDHLKNLKFSAYLPFAFTEQGVAMLSSVLNSDQAIQVNIQIMRAFARIREMIQGHKDLWNKIENMEKEYDHRFKIVFDALKKLIEPCAPPKRRIGFYS